MNTTEIVSYINQRICTMIFPAQLLKNSKKNKTRNNQMPINYKVNKLYLYDEILNNTNKEAIPTKNNMDETHKYNVLQ